MNTNSRAGSPSLLRRATTGGVAPSSTPPVTLLQPVAMVTVANQRDTRPLAGVGCDVDRQLIHQRQMSGPSCSIQALAAREDRRTGRLLAGLGCFIDTVCDLP